MICNRIAGGNKENDIKFLRAWKCEIKNASNTPLISISTEDASLSMLRTVSRFPSEQAVQSCETMSQIL